MIKIAPSILSSDLTNLENELKLIKKAQADYVHIDCMDGHFVPNIAFGPSFVKAIRKKTSLVLDVHLMLSNPIFYLDKFIDAGSDIITSHLEVISLDEFIKMQERLHEKGIKAGLSIKPDTSLNKILPYLKYVDLVLIMSVMPGFSGQEFISSSLKRVKLLNEIKKENSYNFEIEVDGGIDDTNYKELVNRGATILVSGSYLFKDHMKEKIERMKRYE